MRALRYANDAVVLGRTHRPARPKGVEARGRAAETIGGFDEGNNLRLLSVGENQCYKFKWHDLNTTVLGWQTFYVERCKRDCGRNHNFEHKINNLKRN